MFSNWQVCDFEGGFASLLHGAGFGCYRNVLVDLSLPNEIEIELTVVGQCHDLGLLFVDEEISIFKLVRLSSSYRCTIDIREDGVVDFVTLALDI
jgi:hypothetical protein